jgi:hypothetical protein
MTQSINDQIKMFGMTKEEIHQMMDEQIMLDMLPLSIASDIQHLLEHGADKEEIRQMLNVQKYVMSKLLERRMAA